MDLDQRISESFSRVVVKPPFSTAPQLQRYEPTGAHVAGVLFRLREILTDGELGELTEPEAYRRDVPKAQVHMLDAGHFALDTAADEIAELVRGFMGNK